MLQYFSCCVICYLVVYEPTYLSFLIRLILSIGFNYINLIQVVGLLKFWQRTVKRFLVVEPHLSSLTFQHFLKEPSKYMCVLNLTFCEEPLKDFWLFNLT